MNYCGTSDIIIWRHRLENARLTALFVSLKNIFACNPQLNGYAFVFPRLRKPYTSVIEIQAINMQALTLRKSQHISTFRSFGPDGIPILIMFKGKTSHGIH